MRPLEKWMAENEVKDGELATRLGISRVQVLRLRSGENRPSRKTALKLQEITQIPAGTLMLGEEAA